MSYAQTNMPTSAATQRMVPQDWLVVDAIVSNDLAANDLFGAGLASAVERMANIQATKGTRKQAQIHLRNAKALKVSEPTIKEQLKQLEQSIKGMGAMNHANRMGNRGGGMVRQGKSKRRRPKMR